MTPIEAFDYIVLITGKAKLTRDGHERVKVALMTLRSIVEQAASEHINDRVDATTK